MIMSLHITHLSAGMKGLEEVTGRLRSLAYAPDLGIPSVEEHVVLSTCNRFEVYVGTSDPAATKYALESLVRNCIPYHKDGAEHFILEGRETVNHLYRVVCGLDSMMVGEDQIQHQVKVAYRGAMERGSVGRRLNSVFTKALAVGKRIRTETKLNNGAVSVGSAAVQMAEEYFGSLEGRTVVVYGAGEMATLIAKCLKGKSLKAVFVSSRTYEHAKQLAYELDGLAIGRESLPEVMRVSDIVLVATAAPHYLIHKEDVEDALRGRDEQLLIIDISMPTNVAHDVAEVPGVRLCRMDGLKEISLANMSRRRQAMCEAEAIVMEELRCYEEELKERDAGLVIGQLSRQLAEIRDQELRKAYQRLETAVDMREVMDDLTNALVSKIMALPYNRLKEASRNGDHVVCRTAEYLFLSGEE